jgi:hypothetical protein
MSQTYLNYSGGFLFATMSKPLKKSGQKVVNHFPSHLLNKRKGSGCDSASHFDAQVVRDQG